MKYISRKLIKAVMPFGLAQWENSHGRLERRSQKAFFEDIKRNAAFSKVKRNGQRKRA
jgi:hypothetical protein